LLPRDGARGRGRIRAGRSADGGEPAAARRPGGRARAGGRVRAGAGGDADRDRNSRAARRGRRRGLLRRAGAGDQARAPGRGNAGDDGPGLPRRRPVPGGYRGRGSSADPGPVLGGCPAGRVPAGRDLPGPDEPGRAESGGTRACRRARDPLPGRPRRSDPAADRPARPRGVSGGRARGPLPRQVAGGVLIPSDHDVPARAAAGPAPRQPGTGPPAGIGAPGRPALPDQDHHGAGRGRPDRPGPHLFPHGPHAPAAQRDRPDRHHRGQDDGLHGHAGIQSGPQARQRTPPSARRRPAAETTELEVFLP
jgi:hypothetical protein